MTQEEQIQEIASRIQSMLESYNPNKKHNDEMREIKNSLHYFKDELQSAIESAKSDIQYHTIESLKVNQIECEGFLRGLLYVEDLFTSYFEN